MLPKLIPWYEQKMFIVYKESDESLSQRFWDPNMLFEVRWSITVKAVPRPGTKLLGLISPPVQKPIIFVRPLCHALCLACSDTSDWMLAGESSTWWQLLWIPNWRLFFICSRSNITLGLKIIFSTKPQTRPATFAQWHLLKKNPSIYHHCEWTVDAHSSCRQHWACLAKSVADISHFWPMSRVQWCKHQTFSSLNSIILVLCSFDDH